MKMKKINLKKYSGFLYFIIIAVLSFMFFTNDFGLVDIRKTSVIVALGLDSEDDELKVTAQVAVSQPSAAGENTQFAFVKGTGDTVADALKEINGKTGFYPKLLFCDLIIIGESCHGRDIFEILDFFYRNEYSSLTASVATCQGDASELLECKLPYGDDAATALERLLSAESQKSGTVSLVDLKKIGQSNFGESKSCFMPYIVAQSHKCGGGSPENSGSGGGGGSSGDGGGQSTSKGDEIMEFTCERTALFTDGKFAALLEEDQAFALNLLTADIRHTTIKCENEGIKYTLGIRSISGGSSVDFENSRPQVKISFTAYASMQDRKAEYNPEDNSQDKALPEKFLNGANLSLKQSFASLMKALGDSGCDALGLKSELYANHYDKFEEYKDANLYTENIIYDVNVKATG